MKRNTLLVLSCSLALGGLVLLIFVDPAVEAQSIDLQGIVNKIDTYEKVSFISFVPENFTVISFKVNDISNGEHVLHGHLQPYKGSVEFVVDSYD